MLSLTITSCSGSPTKALLELIQCPYPMNITNGLVVVNNGTTFESTIEYSCYSGFDLVGAPTRTCLSDATWSGDIPTCVFAGMLLLSLPINVS